MGYKEFAGLTGAQLREREELLRKELLMLRFDKASGRVLDTTAPRRKRIEIAQLMTRRTELESVKNG